MKKLKLILILLVLVTGNALYAQQQGSRQQGPKMPDSEEIVKMIEDLTSQLLLSDDQAEEVSTIFTQHFEEIETKMSGESRPDRDQMESLKAEFEKDIKSILNEDQIKNFEEYMKEQNKNQGKQRGRR